MLLSPGEGKRKEMDHATVRKRQEAMKRNKEAGRSPRKITAIIGDKVRLKRTDRTFSDPIEIKEINCTSVTLINDRKWPMNKVSHQRLPTGR